MFVLLVNIVISKLWLEACWPSSSKYTSVPLMIRYQDQFNWNWHWLWFENTTNLTSNQSTNQFECQHSHNLIYTRIHDMYISQIRGSDCYASAYMLVYSYVFARSRSRLAERHSLLHLWTCLTVDFAKLVVVRKIPMLQCG